MTTSSNQTAGSPETPPQPSSIEPAADALFLRRILFGLIAATVLTGAMTAALTTRPPVADQEIEVAVGQ